MELLGNGHTYIQILKYILTVIFNLMKKEFIFLGQILCVDVCIYLRN